MDRIYKIRFYHLRWRAAHYTDDVIDELQSLGYEITGLSRLTLRVHNITPAKETMLMLKIANNQYWLEPQGWLPANIKQFGSVQLQAEYHG
tara:strand:+ start:3572 stop:3844 length:273 start_codon:yes stop_codon:yes gene_type:complete